MAKKGQYLEKSVQQSRTISESKYKTTRDETRLLLMAMVSENRDEIFKERWFDFKLADYAATFNLDNHEASRDTQKAIEMLVDRWIFLRQEDGAFEKVRWIDAVRNDPKYGTKGIRFTQEMIKVLMNQPDRFEYQLSEVVSLDSPEHIRIYDWVYEVCMASDDGVGFVELTLAEMLDRLQLHNHNSYKIYGNFKRVVLKPAVKKVTENTSMTLSFREIKEGRKVTAIEFKGELDKESLLK